MNDLDNMIVWTIVFGTGFFTSAIVSEIAGHPDIAGVLFGFSGASAAILGLLLFVLACKASTDETPNETTRLLSPSQ